MKIKSKLAVLTPPNINKGEKIFEFIMNLKEVRLNEGNTLPEKLLSASKKTSNEFLSKVYNSVAEHLNDINSEELAKRHLACLESSDTCTFVWYACGSCLGNMALVEAYCPEGNYSWCEEC